MEYVLHENCSLINKDLKYYYTYKISNLINNKYYYGKHSTNNLYDNYSGSGTILKNAYKKYGKENFKFEVLKYFHNENELNIAEKELINDSVIFDKNSYNITIGGHGGKNKNLLNKVTVCDKNGKTYCVSKNDLRYLNGELSAIAKNKIPVKDKNGVYKQILKSEYDSSLYTTVSKGKITVKDVNGNKLFVDITDPKYVSGEYIPYSSGFCNLINNKTGKLEYVEANKCGKTHYSPFKNQIPDNKNKICVFDLNLNQIYVDKNDDRINKTLFLYKDIKKKSNKIKVRTPENKIKIVFKTDPKYISGEYIDASLRKCKYKDKDGKILQFYSNNPECKGLMKQQYGYIINNNYQKIVIFPDDIRLQTGECILKKNKL